MITSFTATNKIIIQPFPEVSTFKVIFNDRQFFIEKNFNLRTKITDKYCVRICNGISEFSYITPQPGFFKEDFLMIYTEVEPFGMVDKIYGLISNKSKEVIIELE